MSLTFADSLLFQACNINMSWSRKWNLRFFIQNTREIKRDDFLTLNQAVWSFTINDQESLTVCNGPIQNREFYSAFIVL